MPLMKKYPLSDTNTQRVIYANYIRLVYISFLNILHFLSK